MKEKYQAHITKIIGNISLAALGALLGGSWGALGELLGPSAPKRASRTEKIGSRVAPRAPSWDPILDMLAPSSWKKLSEQYFLGSPVRDHVFIDFFIEFRGGLDTKNRALAYARLKFSLFHQFHFCFDFGPVFGTILGSKFATILLFGLPEGAKSGRAGRPR